MTIFESTEALSKKHKRWLYFIVIMMTMGLYFETVAILLWVILNGLIFEWFKTINNHGKLYLYLLLSSVIPIIVLSYPFDKFFIQFGLVFVYLQSYFLLMKQLGDNKEDAFKIYCNVALVVVIAGIILYFLSRFSGYYFSGFIFQGFSDDYTIAIGDKSRAKAWLSESSYFGMFIVPSLIYNCIKSGFFHWKSIIFIIAGLLTFSPVFKLVLALFGAFYFISGRITFKQLFFCGILLLIASSVSNSINELGENAVDDSKTSETLEYWDASFAQIDNTNMSTYALLKNFKISRMADSRLFGTGIGTHGYSHDLLYHSNLPWANLNKHDAFSFGVRIFSELGFVGLFLFLFFLIKGFNKSNDVNISVFFFLVYAFIRGGHYTLYGFIFFLITYYYTSKFKIKG